MRVEPSWMGLVPLEKRPLSLRPYHPERARSLLISEAKQGRAWLVLGWEKRGPWELPLPFYHVRIWWEHCHEYTRKWVLIRHHPIWGLDLGLPRLQNYRKYICVVYKPSSLWYFVIAAWTTKIGTLWISAQWPHKFLNPCTSLVELITPPLHHF